MINATFQRVIAIVFLSNGAKEEERETPTFSIKRPGPVDVMHLSGVKSNKIRGLVRSRESKQNSFEKSKKVWDREPNGQCMTEEENLKM